MTIKDFLIFITALLISVGTTWLIAPVTPHSITNSLLIAATVTIINAIARTKEPQQ